MYQTNRSMTIQIRPSNSIIKQLKQCLLSESQAFNLDDKLNFSLYVNNICKSAANQLSALIRLNKFFCFEGKRVLINSYFMLNFNYCPLVWMFSNATSLKKLENLLKRALRFLCNIYQLTYEELLDKTNRSTMNVKRIRFLCVEIYKTINNLNPSFMKQIFELRETNRNVREKYRLNLNIPNYNQVTFGKKSLRIFGPKIWNSLPYHIKSSKNLETFKTVIRNWDGVNCQVCDL